VKYSRLGALARAILLSLSVLSGCKQTEAFSQAADLKQTSDQITTLAGTMGSDPVKSCERIIKYDLLAQAYTFSSLQGVPGIDAGCAPQASQALELQKHLEIFALYADQLERAATDQPVDYKLGDLSAAMSNAKIIGSGGSSDATAIGQVGNAIAAFLTSNARYDLIRTTVLTQNTAIQEMARYAEAVAVSQWCDDSAARQAHTRPGYCAIYQPEMERLSLTYCIIGKRIFDGPARCSAAPSVIPIAVPGTDESRASLGQCDPTTLRATLQDGIHLAAQPAPTPASFAVTPSPPASVSRPPQKPMHAKGPMSAADLSAQQQFVSAYLDGIDTIYSAVRTGWSYGSAVCEFARAHQNLYDFLNGSQEKE
jgi:hypothetical protein